MLEGPQFQSSKVILITRKQKKAASKTAFRKTICKGLFASDHLIEFRDTGHLFHFFFSLSGGEADMAIDPMTGEFTWTAPADSGQFPVTVIVTVPLLEVASATPLLAVAV